MTNGNAPRFSLAAEEARRLAVMTGEEQLPLRPERAFEALREKLVPMKYGDARRIFGLEDPCGLKRSGADALSVWHRGLGRFLVLYDEGRDPRRVRFTLAHELGHILLGHLTGPEEERSRGDAAEKEADAFAAEFLAPSSVLRPLLGPKEAPFLTADRLALLCDISRESALFCLDRLSREEETEDSPLAQRLRLQLLDGTVENRGALLLAAAKRRGAEGQTGFEKAVSVCAACGAYVYAEAAARCPCCGRTLKLSAGEGRGDAQDAFVFLSLLREAPFCPRCLNERRSPEDRYCRVCGFPLRNRCLRENRPLPADLSFCPVCGSPSAWYTLLRARREQREALRQTYPENERFSRWPHLFSTALHALRRGNIRLLSALLFSELRIGDDGNLLCLAPCAAARRDILRESGTLLEVPDLLPGRRRAIAVYAAETEGAWSIH